MYANTYYNVEYIYVLRQVDGFAVSAPSKSTAEHVISAIDEQMTILIKPLDVVNRCNGMNIAQTKKLIKVYNKTYIEKILKDKYWLYSTIPGHEHPVQIPMHSDPAFNKEIEQAILITDKELKAIEIEMSFSYKQGIGELIYAMVTCRPDISSALIKLSQYSTKPAKIHFEAVRCIYVYLKLQEKRGYVTREQNNEKTAH